MILNTRYSITIGWLYPDLMSTYGDRGNIIALTRRLEWRGIEAIIKPITVETSLSELRASDLLFMGGAQDRQQTIVAQDLQKKKKVLSHMIEDNVPGLYICGGFQFLGNYYKEADGTMIEQLGVLDVYTENPGGKRLIGNIAVDATAILHPVIPDLIGDPGKKLDSRLRENDRIILVGFENHGGRTRLGVGVHPLGKVMKGYGSNAEDHTEGAIYKNSIGTYLHGPILPKNPLLTDWLIRKALERKFKVTIDLPALDDRLATLAHDEILKRM